MSHVSRFIRASLEKEYDSRTPLANVYTAYTQWCRDQKIYPVTKRAFTKEMRSLQYKIDKVGGNHVTCLWGYYVKDHGNLYE